MNTTTIDPFMLFSILLLGAFFVYLGWTHRIEEEERNKAGKVKTVTAKLLAPSLFVVIGSGEYGLAISLVLAFGLSGISFLLGLAAAMLLISFMAPRIKEQIDKPGLRKISYAGYQSISTPDFINFKFGATSSCVATILTASAFWGILLLQFLVGGTIISAISGLSITLSVLIMAVVVFLYTAKGGFAALYLTDLWQSILMWVGLLVVVIYLHISHGDVVAFSKAKDTLFDISTVFQSDSIVIYLFLITVIAAFSGPDLWQRVNMASTSATATKGLRWAAAGVVFFGVILFIFSVDVKAVLSTQPNINEGNELLQYLQIVVSNSTSGAIGELVWPDWLKIVFAFGLLSAFVSTADTCAMLVATSIQNELARPSTQKIKTNNRTTNVILFFSCVSAALVSLLAPALAASFTAVLGVLGVLGLPTFIALFGRGNSLTFLFAVIGGGSILVGQTFFYPQFNDGLYLFLPFLPGLIPLLVKSK